MIVRTGYSFKSAVGHLSEVVSRVKEIGSSVLAVADTCSTYSFVKLTKEAEGAGLRMVYGVELLCCPELGAKRQGQDRWIFLAKDDLRSLHDLIGMATENPGSEPCLTYKQALEAEGVIRIMGEAAQVRLAKPQEDLFLGLSPATPRGQAKAAREAGHPFLAYPNNKYPRKGDLEFYRVTLGRSAGSQTYLMHILDDTEYAVSLGWVDLKEICKAISNRDEALASCQAKLKKASLLVPDKPKDLRQLCLEGAERVGCDLSRPEYRARLDRELAMIKEKEFEDYFHIVADIMAFARDHMVVGPARGSSCGSLVCYLLGITSIDPIPFDLVFERFIDVTRRDLPDIDVDLSERSRHLVFEYASRKYGIDRSARLGSVNMLKAKAALRQVGSSLKIPSSRINELRNTIVKRSQGDNRASSTISDAINETDVGRRLLSEFPEIEVVGRMEEHPAAAAQHAAGVVLTNTPIKDYVAVNQRTGATMCDKRDAEVLNLLKIDALGLLQLSVFERCLELIGQPPRNEFLERIPLDDQAAFDVLNQRRFSGIFQFVPGAATTGLIDRVIDQGGRLDRIDDVVALTAIVRPGPLASGQADEWIKRRVGRAEVSYAHPSLEPYLSKTYGLVLYQEQVLSIGREIGGLDWDDVTALRKAMSKSLGKEYFSRFADKWVDGATQKAGMPRDVGVRFFDDLCNFGAWAFNLCLGADTLIEIVDVGFLNKQVRIEDLWEMYHGDGPKALKNQGETPGPRLISLVDGKGVPQRMLRVHKNGLRPCLRFTFDDGSIIACTNEHRFIINGSWMVAGKSEPGDLWLSLTKSKKEHVGPGKGHVKGKTWGDMRTHGRSGSVNPAWDNGRTLARLRFIESMTGQSCHDCGVVHRRMEVHHLDFNAGKDRPDDMIWLCPGCHKKRHYAVGRTKKDERPQIQATKVLISIEDVGLQETYDIEMPEVHNFKLANGLVTHNSHSVAYGVVSYWCMWLKAHYPLEFSAATLDSHSDPYKQIEMLRELRTEGVSYVPVDAKRSTTRWELDREGRILVGPLTNVVGIGPKKVAMVMDSRENGTELKPALRKLIEHAKTPIDSLEPIWDAVLAHRPKNIVSEPTAVIDLKPGDFACVFVLVTSVSPVDENVLIRVAKRGYEYDEPYYRSVQFWARDDTGEIFCKIGRFDCHSEVPGRLSLGERFVERARPKKSLFAVKGWVPRDFRMIRVQSWRYIGEIDYDPEELAAAVNRADREAAPRDLSGQEEGLELEGVPR